MSDLDRRNFVGLLGIGSLGSLVASTAGAQGAAAKASNGLKTGRDDPPELAQLQQKIEPYLQGMAEQIIDLTGGRDNLKQDLEALLADPDRDPVDWSSLVHFLSGAVFGALCFSFKWTLILLILWEVIEPWIWEGWNESPINIVMDVIIGMLGWMVASIIKEIVQAILAENGELPADLVATGGKA